MDDYIRRIVRMDEVTNTDVISRVRVFKTKNRILTGILQHKFLIKFKLAWKEISHLPFVFLFLVTEVKLKHVEEITGAGLVNLRFVLIGTPVLLFNKN